MEPDEQLPPWPDDEWGRWLRPTGLAYGSMWVRPARVAEQSPAIETLSQQHAARIVESWIFDSGERQFVHKLHARTCGLPAHLDPDRRWEQVTRELRVAFASGRVVIQRPRPQGGLPGTLPIDPPPPAPERPWFPEPQQKLTWIEIELIDENDQAVADEQVSIVDASGGKHAATTNEAGLVRLDSLETGTCDVSFPRIDGREWSRFGDSFPDGDDAVEKVHLAHADECMGRIAYAYKFRSPSTLYRHPCNAELRGLRPNPDLLWPGDRVNILVRDERVDSAATGRRHRYRVKAAVRWLRVVLHGFDRQPLASTTYVFRVDGRGPVSRTTDERGLLEEVVPAWAVHASIQAAGYAWDVAIGALVPTKQTPDQGQRGALQRLANLGHPVSAREKVAATETAGEDSEAPFDVEVWRFQRREALAASGDLDAAVVHAAVKRHRV